MFSPRGCQKIFNSFFKRGEKVDVLQTMSYYFISFPSCRKWLELLTNQSVGQCNLFLPYHFPEILYVRTQKSKFPLCAFRQRRERLIPNFFRTLPLFCAGQKPQARMHMYTHTRTHTWAKKEQLFNIITQAYDAFAHISAEGLWRQSSLN